MKTVLNVNLDEALKQEHLVLLEFQSPQCAHCKMLEPALKRLEAKYTEQMKRVTIDIFTSGDIADRYNVMSVPTLLFLKQRELKDKLIGNTYEEIIEEKIKKYI